MYLFNNKDTTRAEIWQWCVDHGQTREFHKLPAKTQREMSYHGQPPEHGLYQTRAGYIYAVIVPAS